MKLTPSKAPQQARGLSMMEVLLATFILAICAMTLLFASTTSGQATRQAAEYAAAVGAARKKMEELCNVPTFEALVRDYGEVNPLKGNTFGVMQNEGVEYIDAAGAKKRGQELPGYYKTVNGNPNYDAGEVVIITHENRTAASYGYKCVTSLTNTYPDGNMTNGGITFTGLPIDLNGDGNTTSGNCFNLNATPQVKSAWRLPVGIIVRWEGVKGPERYELWTVLGNY